jgi:uncharacterized membrane protein YjjP (DUF1212 family)
MDPATSQVFKVKFIKLTMLLNVIMLLYAGAVVAYFLLGADLNLPVAIVLGGAAVLLSLYFRKAYAEDKAWLHEQE